MINAFSLLPQEIRYNKKISAQAKIVWCEIYCYNYCKIYTIRNITLSNDLGLSVTQISRLISQLRKQNVLLVFEQNHERRLVCVYQKKEEESKEGKPHSQSEEFKNAMSYLDRIITK